MNARDRFRRFEAERKLLFEQLEDVDDERLNRSPHPGAWSVLQVVSHLTVSDRLSASYIEKKLSDPSRLVSVGVVGLLRAWLVVVTLRSPLRVRAPKIVADVPERLEFAAAWADWDAARRAFAAVVNSCPAEFARLGVFRHALAGRMNLDQCVLVSLEHFRHHQRQITRILRAAA